MIIGNSSKVLDAFYPGWRANDKFAVAHNGVDLKKFSPAISGRPVRDRLGIPEGRIVIGHTGTFHYAKNHFVLLESFSRLIQEVEEAHLLLVGDGELRGRVETSIEKLGINSHVTLAGRTKDVPGMLAAMDIYLFPSLYEGQPNALLEAMATGLPIVASNIEEIVEIVPPTLRTQLFAPKGAEGFAEAVKKLCSDEARRKCVGIQARQHVKQHFSLWASAENFCRYLYPQ